MRLVQLVHPEAGRAVAVVRGDRLAVVRGCASLRDLAREAFRLGEPLAATAEAAATDAGIGYDEVWRGASPWALLPAIDHPDDPARCLVTGTGLTHLASALSRQAMHAHAAQGAAQAPVAAGAAQAPVAAQPPPSDSLRMYRWGVEGGRPEPGAIGVQPEWFFKGRGEILRAHGEPLDVPAFAEDGGEEAEIAGLYWIDPHGEPRRIGFAIGNEFSDHVLEERNYLYLASSKLRACAIGPEAVLDEGAFADVRGRASIERGGDVIWSGKLHTGAAAMSHTLENLEHHHFKHAVHRRPDDVHVHFLGADAFSYGDRIRLADGDVMEVELAGFGRPLRNPIRIRREAHALVRARPL